MIRLIQGVWLAVITAALTGCGQVQRIVWSPDGSIAAVLAGDGLRFCDAEGKLTPLRLPGAYAAEWFPDGRELLVSRVAHFRSWDQVAQVLPEAGQKQIIELADAVAPMLTGEPDWEAIDARIAETMPPSEARTAIYFVLRDLRGDAAAARFAAKYEYVKNNELQITILERLSVDGTEVQRGAVIAWSLEFLVASRISPTLQSVAYTIVNQRNDEADLFIASLEGDAAAIPVASRLAAYPDWTRDGRYLVYIAASQDVEEIGTVYRRAVHGSSLDGEAQPLAHMLMPGNRVRCLPDGRIVFATLPVTLPVTEADVPQRQQLFALDPDRQATITRLTPMSAEHELPQQLMQFELSPDFTKIAFLGEKGRVTIMELASGKTTPIETHEPQEIRTLPAWRNNQQLTLSVSHIGESDEYPNRDEIVLWSEDSTVKVLSASWPPEATEDFLESRGPSGSQFKAHPNVP